MRLSRRLWFLRMILSGQHERLEMEIIPKMENAAPREAIGWFSLLCYVPDPVTQERHTYGGRVTVGGDRDTPLVAFLERMNGRKIMVKLESV